MNMHRAGSNVCFCDEHAMVIIKSATGSSNFKEAGVVLMYFHEGDIFNLRIML